MTLEEEMKLILAVLDPKRMRSGEELAHSLVAIAIKFLTSEVRENSPPSYLELRIKYINSLIQLLEKAK